MSFSVTILLKKCAPVSMARYELLAKKENRLKVGHLATLGICSPAKSRLLDGCQPAGGPTDGSATNLPGLSYSLVL